MEKSSQREKILLGPALRRSFTNPTSSPRSPSPDSEVDFHDVFGGPPRRRSSVHETRYSFTETFDSLALRGGDEALASRSSPWSGLNEKPVFGDDSAYGRRRPSDEFYDDIFRNDELANSPRKHDRDVFSSIPSSRALSPTRPLPPSAEPFGSSSLPAQLSLPRMAKGTDLPPFGSSISSPYKQEDSASNGSHTNSPRFALSRFSSISSPGHDDLKIDYKSSNRTGLLSSEFLLSSEETTSFRKFDSASSGNSLTKGSDRLEDPTSQIQFHFQIYKWASKGVPLMMPLRGGNGSRLKEKTVLSRSSSAKESLVKEKNERQSPTSTIHNIDLPLLFHETENSEEGNRERNDLLPNIDEEDKRNQCQNMEETILATFSQSALKDVGHDTIKPQTREKAEKKMSLLSKEDQKHEMNTSSSLLSHSYVEQGEKGISSKEKMVKIEKKSSIISRLSSRSKKQDKETSPRKEEKVGFTSSEVDSKHNSGRKKVGGKVSEFVKIFNQEPASKVPEDQSSRVEQKDTSKTQTEATVDKIGIDEKPKLNNNTEDPIKEVNLEKMQHLYTFSKQPADDNSAKKTASDSSNSSKQDSSAPKTVPMPDASKKSVIPDMEEPFQENFLIKELPEDYDDVKETDNGLEELKVIDAKIRQWSNGKEGNIRSLLSTLQYVLWPGSGWKPVPLVDIIEGSAVKRSYQKALLYLHPDKLQQKGASSNQKYMAAKVFDILQEAWDHFNTLGGL